MKRQDGFQETRQEADMDDQPDDNPVDKGHAVVETVGYGMLPERLKKQIKKMEQQLRKEGIDTLTGLPVPIGWEWHKKSLTRRIVSSEWTRH